MFLHQLLYSHGSSKDRKVESFNFFLKEPSFNKFYDSSNYESMSADSKTIINYFKIDPVFDYGDYLSIRCISEDTECSLIELPEVGLNQGTPDINN